MRRQVLFVDDETPVLDGLKRMLRGQAGVWDIDYVTSAAEAWDVLGRKSLDVIVTDVRMPKKDGLQLLAEIKADPSTQDVEVIVLTGLADRDLKRRALGLGATDLLNKPIFAEDLIARLNSALQAKAYRDELKHQNEILENQLRQSHKIYTIGLMAAGVAHDLNNIIAGILGYSDLTAHYIAENPPAEENLLKVRAACERALQMVRHILQMTRGADAEDTRFDLAQVVGEAISLLKILIPRSIHIEWESPGTGHAICGDSTQAYQVAMNLCLNASQAIEDEGVIRVTLTEATHDSLSVLEEPHSGKYARLQITDSGTGMSEETLMRIFEPSFTTKATEHSFGIGLSVVRRTLEDLGGAITVKSSLGKGTTFSVFLPYADRSTASQLSGVEAGHEETHSIC